MSSCRTIGQNEDPELSINRALEQYVKLGFTECWINQRLKSIEIRKELTDELNLIQTMSDIISYQTEDGSTKIQV